MSINAISARVRLTWPKQHVIDPGGSFNAYGDDGDGSIDYNSRLNAAAIPAWPTIAGKFGFLLGGFLGGGFLEGDGGFGFLSGGFLEGAFLLGDADQEVGPATGFLTDKLADGLQKFGLKALDAAGNESTAVEASVTVQGVPEPVTGITAVSLVGDTLTLNWTKSIDDTT